MQTDANQNNGKSEYFKSFEGSGTPKETGLFILPILVYLPTLHVFARLSAVLSIPAVSKASSLVLVDRANLHKLLRVLAGGRCVAGKSRRRRTFTKGGTAGGIIASCRSGKFK